MKVNTANQSLFFVGVKNFLDRSHSINHKPYTHSQIQSVAKRAQEAMPANMGTHLKMDKKIQSSLNDIIVSPHTPWAPNLERLDLSPRQTLIFNILRGKSTNLDELFKDDHLLTTVLKKHDKAVLKEAREVVIKILFDMFKQIENDQKKFSEADHFHMEMIIGDLLALYPYLNPGANESLSIPIRLGTGADKKWSFVSYQVETLQLTPKWMGSPITAYGLKPLNNKSAPPLLLYKGTTYPTDDGFGLSLITDLNPRRSIGHLVYQLGREKIKKWFNENTTPHHKAVVYGKSLGGSESCLTVLDFPDHIDKVMVYGSPGYSSKDMKRFNHLYADRKKQNGHFPEIHAFCQLNDPVPFTDHAPKEGITYYEVVGSKKRTGVLAHADMFSTHENSVVLKMNPHHQKYRMKKIGMTSLRSVMSILAFPFILLVHACLVVKHR